MSKCAKRVTGVLIALVLLAGCGKSEPLSTLAATATPLPPAPTLMATATPLPPAPTLTATATPEPTATATATALPSPALTMTAVPASVPLALIGNLIDGTGADLMLDAVLVIQDGLVVALGPRSEVKLPPGAQIIEMPGATILPGFINAHVHNAYIEVTLAQWAQAGVTTVRDLGARLDRFNFSTLDRLNADPSYATVIAAGPLVTVPGGYPIAGNESSFPALAVTSPDHARREVAQLIRDGADVVKIVIDSGSGLPTLSLERAAAIVETAHAKGVPVTAHVTSLADLQRAVSAGVDDIAHMVGHERVPDSLLQEMVEAGIYWVPTLEPLQGMDAGNLRRFIDAGGQVALGNDGGLLPGVELGMPMREIEMLHAAGMTPMEIIVAATRNAAHVCRRGKTLGTLEVGKVADVLVVDGDPLQDLQVIGDPRLVIHEGVVIYATEVAPPEQAATPVPAPSQAALGDAWTRPQDGATMVYVPGGEFVMGSAETDVDAALADCRQNYQYCNYSFYAHESPQHSVRLDSFWLDQAEVTNAQYRQCVEAGVCAPPATCDQGESTFEDAAQSKHPVVCVDWSMAQAYCQWAGARLPTEAEWEYAARGEQDNAYPWGDAPDGALHNYCDVNCQEDWADAQVDDGYAKTSPVRAFPEAASWCGALDMAGNVYEWAADWMGAYEPGAQSNPSGPGSGRERVLRGSSWFSFQGRARAATRDKVAPTKTSDLVGFRCALAPLPPAVADIRTYVEDLAAQEQFSGAVLVARDGAPVFQAAFGLADRTLNAPNQVDTKFNLGSMDKMFTAIAVLQLVEQGQLSLDDRIVDVLPAYANGQVASQVTLHQLLMHTSGLGNYFDSALYEDMHDQIRSLADYALLFVDEPLLFEPGAQFGYSNSGFIVLGLIIQEVTGQDYYAYVREHIFKPAGMTNTAAYELDAGTPNLALGYTYLDEDGNETGVPRDNSFAMPMRGGSAGGGFSTAGDLLKFENALLDYQFLSPDSTELLLEGKIRLGENAQYAYGFFDRQYGDQRIVGHSGGFPGICSSLEMYLNLGYTLVVLSNSDGDCMPVIEFARERFLEQ